jgi:hypothetical protein
MVLTNAHSVYDRAADWIGGRDASVEHHHDRVGDSCGANTNSRLLPANALIERYDGDAGGSSLAGSRAARRLGRV